MPSRRSESGRAQTKTGKESKFEVPTLSISRVLSFKRAPSSSSSSRSSRSSRSRHSPSSPPISGSNKSSGGFIGMMSRVGSTASSQATHVEPAPAPKSSGIVHSFSVKAGNLFQRNEPNGISSARRKVVDAEVAEREAQQALAQAKQKAKAARSQVRLLEQETSEAAKRALAQQAEAQRLMKTAKTLGRH